MLDQLNSYQGLQSHDFKEFRREYLLQMWILSCLSSSFAYNNNGLSINDLKSCLGATKQSLTLSLHSLKKQALIESTLIRYHAQLRYTPSTSGLEAVNAFRTVVETLYAPDSLERQILRNLTTRGHSYAI